MPGPKGFVPTDEQRRQVTTLASLGIPAHEICNLIFWNGKSISEATLKRRFKEELASSQTRLNAQVGSLYVASILGREPPPGTVAITKEEPRANMMMFFMKNRAGWSDRVSVQGGDPKRPIIYAPVGGDRNL